MASGEVQDELEITLCRGDGVNVQLAYRLDGDERAALLDKMRDYCQEQTGQSLEDYATSLRIDGPPESQTGALSHLKNGVRVLDVLQMDTSYDIFLTCGQEHGRIPLGCLNELTDAGRKIYAALLDATVTGIRTIDTEMEIELTLDGVTPEELDQFYKDYEAFLWAEDYMEMYM